ncbi:hypothetical protein Neosp_015041 [[Neocosmospora] mangrovei]
MNIISKRRKPLLYAQNSPKDSVGLCLGTLPAGRFGRIQCWEAVGDARREFTEQLKGNIIEYLEQNNDKVQDSGSIIDLSLFMLGRSTTQAKPTVMFVSEDKRARKEAFNMIKDSKIIEKYPGFELGHIPLTAEFENLEFLAGGDESFEYSGTFLTDESLDVFWTQSSRLEGSRIFFYTKLGCEEIPRTATAGGVITYRGKPMLLTVNHFLEPTQTIATPSFFSVSEEGEGSEDECEITGLSDFDDFDEDRLIEITSEGSITPEFETSDVDSSRSGNNKVSAPSSGSTTDVQNNTMVLQERLEHIEQNQASIPLDGASRQQFTRAGKVIVRSKELDYSLVEIDHPLTSIDDLEDSTIELGEVSRIEPCCRDAAVKATTPDGGIVGGALSGTPSYVRLPQSRAYVEVFFARFNRPFVPGDCGSWVRDALTGRLFGHVFAGSPTSGLTMIMPACRVFEDAQNILESQSHGTGKNVVRGLAGEVEKETHQNRDALAQPPSSEVVYQEQSRRLHYFIDHLEEYKLEDIQRLLAVAHLGVPPGPHMMERLATFKRRSDLSFLFPWYTGVDMAEFTIQDLFKVLPSIINPSESFDEWDIEPAGGHGAVKKVTIRPKAFSYIQGRKDYNYDIHESMKVAYHAHELDQEKSSSQIISCSQFLEDFVWLLRKLCHWHTRKPDSSDQGLRHYRRQDSKIDDFLFDQGPVNRVALSPRLSRDLGLTLTLSYDLQSAVKWFKLHEPQTGTWWKPSSMPLYGRDLVMYIDNFSPMGLQMDTAWETAKVISYLAKVADDNGKDLYFSFDPAHPLKHSSSATIEMTILKTKTLDFRSRALKLWGTKPT